MNNGGGAATNSGIDFQQRIAALVLVHILADIKNYHSLQLGEDVDVNELRFETNDSIDDLVLITTGGRAFIQAKRSVSLSDNVNSDFSKTLRQFVNQYATDHINTDMYILATPSTSSGRITKELKKLTEAIRLNETGGKENPLTKTEKEVLEKTRSLISRHYRRKTGKPISDEVFYLIFKKIHIAVLDIQEGSAHENAVLTLLAGKTNVSPHLLWRNLIALSLSLAKDRLSINQKALIDRMGKFIKNTPDDITKNISEFLRIEKPDFLSVGRDVLLVESLLDDYDYLILELYRFEDDGQKRLKFFNNQVELLNGSKWNVIRRTATFSGIERYIEEQKEFLSNKKICIMPINTEHNIEDEDYVKLYAEHCIQLVESSENLFICLHCGDVISENLAPFIEIDEENSKHCIGLVHHRCLQPLDRVLGGIKSDLFQEKTLLQDFDYNKWFLTAPRGQGGIGSISENLTNQIYTIAWKPDYSEISKGSWCVKIDLEDGSARYAHERGKVTRFSEIEAINHAGQLNEGFKHARNNQDPWCYTLENESFTTYSVILKFMPKNEKYIKCVKSIAVPYTRSIGDSYSRFDNFYAPLALLIDRKIGEPIVIGNAVTLISNPLNLKQYVDNWENAGIELPDFLVSIIESDDKFDKFCLQFKAKGVGILIDPIITMRGELTSGLVVENYYDLLARRV